MIMTKTKLTAEERSFFEKVRLAIFANPFSAERTAVDRQLVKKKPPSNRKKLVDLLIKVVDKQLRQICPETNNSILNFREDDRQLVQYGILFHLFHKYSADFDQHIQEQIRQGDKPCPVNFAADLLAEMVAIGIGKKESVRFFSLFFQMRRAFYFIDQIVGSSPCMKDLRRDLWNNIFTHDIWIYDQYLCDRMEDFSTMLLGATGTGKGLAAAAIGRSGYILFNEKEKCFVESFTRVFISINLSLYPEQLLESELFGHKKGAFTGAIQGHDGIFSLCAPSGSIFLDEIGEVTTPVQIKLLQVLQDRIFSPVGSHTQRRFHGRVIAATNRSIDALRAQKLFRDDFYYRLCSDLIHVPSLFQRIQEKQDDLDDLLAHTVQRIIGKPAPELSRKILNIMNQQIAKDYPWPGNVRELEQCVRRILLKQQYSGDTVLSATGTSRTLDELLMQEQLSAQQLLSKYCALLYEKHGSYESVARQTRLDRRTVKKYIDSC